MKNFEYHKITEEYRSIGFYQLNKDLVDNEYYNDLSANAMVLYALLCSRLDMTYKNEKDSNTTYGKKHYYDDEKNVYVIFTRMNMCQKIHAGKAAVSKAIKQLNKANLIREIKQGNNKPNLIYVGKTISEIEGKYSRGIYENKTSGDFKKDSPEVRKSVPNYIYRNIYNNYNKSSNSISNYKGRDYSEVDLTKLYANNNFINQKIEEEV